MDIKIVNMILKWKVKVQNSELKNKTKADERDLVI